MAARLPSKLLIGALIARVQQAGGFAAILVRGEDQTGTILVQTMDKGRFSGLYERMLDLDGTARLVRCGPDDDAEPTALSAYVDRRRQRDPDLWVVELDIVDAERFAAETICGG